VCGVGADEGVPGDEPDKGQGGAEEGDEYENQHRANKNKQQMARE
jgi:hypothetical protein